MILVLFTKILQRIFVYMLEHPYCFSQCFDLCFEYMYQYNTCMYMYVVLQCSLSSSFKEQHMFFLRLGGSCRSSVSVRKLIQRHLRNLVLL